MLNALLIWISDLLWPLACVSCRREGVRLCRTCRDSLPPAPPPSRIDGVTLITAGTMKSKAIGRAVWYLKYRNADDVARPLGDLLAAAAGAAGIAGDVIVPVPLHPSRLRRRGYNQADLIARRISAVSALPCLQALSRTRNTKSQLSTGNRMGRFANMQNAFTVALPDAIRGKHVLLVDDVATTGATLGAAAHALQDAGATRVTALAVARG